MASLAVDKKEKKSKKKVQAAAVEAEAAVPVKKSKKSKAPKEDGQEVQKVKTKKRRAEEVQADGAAVAAPKAKKVKKQPSPAASDSATSEQSGLQIAAAGSPPAAPVTAAKDPLALDNFPLAGGIKELLRGKGIAALFPIQAQTLQAVLDGADLVGRARCAARPLCALLLSYIIF